jgi:hypothetical protein
MEIAFEEVQCQCIPSQELLLGAVKKGREEAKFWQRRGGEGGDQVGESSRGIRFGLICPDGISANNS